MNSYIVSPRNQSDRENPSSTAAAPKRAAVAIAWMNSGHFRFSCRVLQQHLQRSQFATLHSSNRKTISDTHVAPLIGSESGMFTGFCCRFPCSER